MRYYKYIDESGNVFQYEKTNRIINSPIVVEITKEEYKVAIAALLKDENEVNYASTVH